MGANYCETCSCKLGQFEERWCNSCEDDGVDAMVKHEEARAIVEALFEQALEGE